MLTQAAAKAAVPRDRAYKLADSGGLFLFVTPAGCKSWRLKYRFAGREKLLVLGRYPELGVPEARRRREDAKAVLRAGSDPAKPSSEASAGSTFEQLARAWYAHNVAAWSAEHAADVIGSLERDVLPAIGAAAIDGLEPPELLQLLREVERRGRIETARRIRQRLSEIFAFGIAEGLAVRDPAASLGAAMLEPRPSVPQPALTSIDDCRALLAACAALPARASTVLASRFLALTAVRLAAVRGMRWSEVEGLDGDAPVWRVPAARMKLKKAKKGLDLYDHVVPLSRAAVAVLRDAARENGYDTRSPDANLHALVFPGRGGAVPIGEGAIGELYARAGYAGRHVPHGWRSSFSTILNEQLGETWSAAIDRALAHSPKDKVEAAYNRAQRLDRRRELFERWGELLAGSAT